MCFPVNDVIAICFLIGHLPEDLSVAGKICLEVVVLELALIFEGLQLLLELPCVLLNETLPKEHDLQFQKGSMEVEVLSKLIDACLGRGASNNDLEFSIAHGQIKDVLRVT